MVHARNPAWGLRACVLAVALVAGAGLLPMGGLHRAAFAGAQEDFEFPDDDPVDFDDLDALDDPDDVEDVDDSDGPDGDEAADEDSGGDGIETGDEGDAPGNGDDLAAPDDEPAAADTTEADDVAGDGGDIDAWSDDTYTDQLDAEAGNDLADDAWAGAYEEDDAATLADDAIPVDDATWGEDVDWDVSEVIDGDADDEDAGGGGDSVAAGGMLVLSTSLRSGASSAGGGKGPRPGTPRPGGADDDEDTPYAYGGRPVSALSVPWQAQIFDPNIRPDPKNPRPVWQRSHYCGGALIAKDWVLTAAHCIDQSMVDEGFKVRLGVSDISRGDGITYRIDRIVRHSQYDADVRDPSKRPNMYGNDIALIRIAEDGAPKRRDPRKIREIPLNRRPLAGGMPVSATGWGAVGTGDAQTASAAILRVDLRLMDTPVCQQRPTYGPLKVHGRVFCAAHPTRSTCRGDSGGPVVLTHGEPVLVGLVSWGKKRCAGDGRPGVYTRIDQYIGWIEQAMKLPPGKNALP